MHVRNAQTEHVRDESSDRGDDAVRTRVRDDCRVQYAKLDLPVARHCTESP